MKDKLLKALVVLMIIVEVVVIFVTSKQEIKGSDIDTCIGEETLQIIEEVSEEYGVCPELIEAIVYCESSGRPDAKSDYGCVGLMQISEKHHKERMKELGVTDLTEPYSNILVGTDYLMELAEKYEDLPAVLMAYNEGEYGDAIDRAGNGDVSKYAAKVMRISEELEKAHGK